MAINEIPSERPLGNGKISVSQKIVKQALAEGGNEK